MLLALGENETKGQQRSWLVPIVVVVLSFGFVRLWETRAHYLHTSSSGALITTLTPLVKTLLSAEDIFFCEHSGIDFARLKWVLRDTLRRGSFDRGASTITMQLVKVRHLSYKKSIFRKILQVFMALWYEARLDKNEIVNMYLNEVSFGPYITGIEQASQHYFQKNSSNLGLREIEYLVATIEDPAHFSPQRLPNLPKDVVGRLEHIRRIRAEFGPYFSKACEKS
jgi:membrane peptidoglycan carboxypeptidase